MSAVVCPNCNAMLPPQELADGWCESCGKKIPSWVRGERSLPPSRDLRSPFLSDRIVHSVSVRQPASRLARLAAAVLDTVLFSLAVMPGFLAAQGMDANTDPSPLSGVLFLLGAGVVGLVQMVLLSTSGQTVGKKIMRIRIVKIMDGSNPGFLGAVLLRAWVPGLIIGIPCVGNLFALVDILFIFADDRRCLHDHIAGTKVIVA